MSSRDYADALSQRSAVGVFRGTLISADDGSKMQTLSIEGMHGETRRGIEHWHPYGFTSVPMAAASGEAEVIGLHVGGSRSHMVAIGVADRRFRPKGLAPGGTALHDHQGQMVAIKEDGVHITPAAGKATFVDVDNIVVTIKKGRVAIEIDGEKVFLITKPPTDLGSCVRLMTESGPAKYAFALPG